MGLLLLNGDAGFNVLQTLFSQNEQGLWLDPSQLSTMYQDSNGVTPCTAAGDPVGLILDQSRGGLSQIGADLVTNGTFAADSDWTKGANWTIGSGVATKTGGAANNLTQTISSTAAAWYQISLDVTRSAGTLTVSLGTSGTTYAITATGSYTFFILAGSGTQTLTLAGDSSFAGTVDNVVVREVPGNHAYQTSSGARPTLARIPSSGRRNLLTRTEEFDNAAWTKSGTTVTQNNTTAPDGTTTADLLIETATSARHWIGLDPNATARNGLFTFSIYVKKKDRRYCFITINNSAGAYRYSPLFDLDTGTVVATNTTGTPTNVSNSITSVGNGWYRITASGDAAAGGWTESFFGLSDSATPSLLVSSPTYAGDGTSGNWIWGAQLETGSTATNYQKVTATTDVTESGVSDLWHLVFDGSDDSLTTNSVDMTGTAQMTVIAGVRKLSDATYAAIVEASTDPNTNNGTFAIGSSALLGGDRMTWNYQAAGTVNNYGVARPFAAPSTIVQTLLADISQSARELEIIGRLNGSQQTLTFFSPATDIGTGNFGNYALYIGRRGGTVAPFNGHLYQLIIRGKTTPTGKLLEAERFVGKKTGVFTI